MIAYFETRMAISLTRSRHLRLLFADSLEGLLNKSYLLGCQGLKQALGFFGGTK